MKSVVKNVKYDLAWKDNNSQLAYNHCIIYDRWSSCMQMLSDICCCCVFLQEPFRNSPDPTQNNKEAKPFTQFVYLGIPQTVPQYHLHQLLSIPVFSSAAIVWWQPENISLYFQISIFLVWGSFYKGVKLVTVKPARGSVFFKPVYCEFHI